jgi:hypothetical protein
MTWKGNRENMRLGNKALTKHGMWKTREYKVWSSMKERCQRANHKAYNHYGGRGITVCERWQTFENFYADMGPRPDGMTLERINNDKGYSPENCKWATWIEQRGNTRSTNFIEHNGETKTARQWCAGSQVAPKVFVRRLSQGWTFDEALNGRPKRIRAVRMFDWNGGSYTAKELALIHGISTAVLHSRLRVKKLPLEKALMPVGTYKARSGWRKADKQRKVLASE